MPEQCHSWEEPQVEYGQQGQNCKLTLIGLVLVTWQAHDTAAQGAYSCPSTPSNCALSPEFCPCTRAINFLCTSSHTVLSYPDGMGVPLRAAQLSSTSCWRKSYRSETTQEFCDTPLDFFLQAPNLIRIQNQLSASGTFSVFKHNLSKPNGYYIYRQLLPYWNSLFCPQSLLS
jgi:hypothetical protein